MLIFTYCVLHALFIKMSCIRVDRQGEALFLFIIVNNFRYFKIRFLLSQPNISDGCDHIYMIIHSKLNYRIKGKG